MKELSIEEKAKRYDEALEKARQLCAYPTSKPFISDLQDLFSELKESEDERIRKELVNLVKKSHTQGGYALHKDEAERMLNFLEKKSVLYTEYEKGRTDAHAKQKPVKEWSIYDAKAGDVLAGPNNEYGKPWIGIFKCYNGGYATKTFDSYCFITAEEHSFVTPNGCFYNRCSGHGVRGVFPATPEQFFILFKKMIEAGYMWDFEKKELKKIEQPKQEWSEEDDRMVGNIRRIIEKYAFSQSAVDVNGDLCEKEFIDADNWLKSPRFHSQWKPSDEQIECLSSHIAHREKGESSYSLNVLRDLLGQLKKLREEDV